MFLQSFRKADADMSLDVHDFEVEKGRIHRKVGWRFSDRREDSTLVFNIPFR